MSKTAKSNGTKPFTAKHGRPAKPRSFGHCVVDGWGKRVDGLGAHGEFASAPVLMHALRLAAELTWQKYRHGDFGEPGAVLRGNFEDFALDVAHNLVFGKLEGHFVTVWADTGALRADFQQQCGGAFEAWT